MRDEMKQSRGWFICSILVPLFLDSVKLTLYRLFNCFPCDDLGVNFHDAEGCSFVKFSTREMAVEAINNLNGVFTMRVG